MTKNYIELDAYYFHKLEKALGSKIEYVAHEAEDGKYYRTGISFPVSKWTSEKVDVFPAPSNQNDGLHAILRLLLPEIP